MRKEKEFPCIICEKPITIVDLGYFDASDLIQNMWDGGTVDKLYMPYGSSLDGNVYIFGICDDCVKNKIKNGLIFESGIE